MQGCLLLDTDSFGSRLVFDPVESGTGVSVVEGQVVWIEYGPDKTCAGKQPRQHGQEKAFTGNHPAHGSTIHIVQFHLPCPHSKCLATMGPLPGEK